MTGIDRFWFKCPPVGDLRLPISQVQRVALRRNIENMFGSMLGNQNVQALMLNLLHGALTSEQARAVEEVKKLLRHVLPPEEIIGFLQELASNRFNLPVRMRASPSRRRSAKNGCEVAGGKKSC
eukprot:756695-Hanusia_phi.AAC.4